MNPFFRPLALVFLFCTLISCTKSVSNDEIQNLIDNYAESLQSKSAEAMAANFHNEAILFPEGKASIKGKENITEFFKQLESIDFEEEFEIIEVIEGGELLILNTLNTGKWKDPAKGSEGEFTVKGMMTLKRDQQGKLTIYRYMFNSNPSNSAVMSKPIKGDFIHAVYFWLIEPENQHAREQFIGSLRKFIDASPYIRSKHIGTPADTEREVIDNTYTFSLIVTFDSKEEHDKYQKEEAHLQFIDESKGLWKKVQVYDSEQMNN